MSEYTVHRLRNNNSQGDTSSRLLLIELEKVLRDNGYDLPHFHLPLPEVNDSTENRILLDELSYDVQSMQAAIDEDIPRLNSI
jgi:hypothetical protein